MLLPLPRTSPRSKDRGLIEAGRAAWLVPTRAGLRDRKIAASLKRGSRGGRLARRAGLRDRKIAASLKPRLSRRKRLDDHASPRSKDRGLIEAPVTSKRRAAKRPRLRDRKIAASLKRCSDVAHGYNRPRLRDRKIAASLKPPRRPALGQGNRGLRDRKIVASLKQELADALRTENMASPRSKDRGLIEAVLAERG